MNNQSCSNKHTPEQVQIQLAEENRAMDPEKAGPQLYEEIRDTEMEATAQKTPSIKATTSVPDYEDVVPNTDTYKITQCSAYGVF